MNSNGEVGVNTRYSSTTVVIQDVENSGWLIAGAGPAADINYFEQKYPDPLDTYRPISLWLNILFDFGEVGVAVLAVLIFWSAGRMRRQPAMAAILLPFVMSSLINSAEGYFQYEFVALAIMFFAFGWTSPRSDQVSRALTPEAVAPASFRNVWTVR